MLVVMGLISVSNLAPVCSPQVVCESESPVEQSESSVEEAIATHGMTRICRRQTLPQSESRFALPPGIARVVRAAAAVRPGHRLHNNFLAPLRC